MRLVSKPCKYGIVPEFSIEIPIKDDYCIYGHKPVVLVEIYALDEEWTNE